MFTERYKRGHNDSKLEAAQMFNSSRMDTFLYIHAMEMRIHKNENE